MRPGPGRQESIKEPRPATTASQQKPIRVSTALPGLSGAASRGRGWPQAAAKMPESQPAQSAREPESPTAREPESPRAREPVAADFGGRIEERQTSVGAAKKSGLVDSKTS